MRTNIEIDDQLMARAMAALGVKTKREAVEQALREAVNRSDRLRRQSQALDELWGSSTDWGSDLVNIPYDEWPEFAKKLDAETYARYEAESERNTGVRIVRIEEPPQPDRAAASGGRRG